MWLLNFYKTADAFDMNSEDFLLHFDKSIETRILEYSDNIDPMHGLLSIGNYLLQRNNKYADSQLVKIVDILNETKITEEDATYWENGGHELVPNSERHVNFGYAHGIPGILAFLSRLLAKGTNSPSARILFDSTFKYFEKYIDGSASTYFPSHIQKEKIRKNSRVAYCYGDLGISCGLLVIGNNLKDKAILNLSKKVALNIAQISLYEKEGFSDIGLCHGAAGNGHMFLKLYKYFGNEILKNAVVFQYEKLLSLKKKEDGIAGFMSIHYDDETQIFSDKIDAGFINGTTGVGLSILSFLNNGNNCEWDYILNLR